MQNINVDDKYDFEELINILLKNEYTITVSAMINKDDGEVGMYSIDFDKL